MLDSNPRYPYIPLVMGGGRDDGRAFILHKANPSSGGKVSSIELGDFLGAGKAGPEHQALIRLIGSLVESG
jgi:hypothetical protein